MSDLPPVIATNAGTPPDEWARTTTSAAFAPPAPSPSSTQPLNPPAPTAEPEPTTKPHESPTSSTSTPGAELPGAYPRHAEEPTEKPKETAPAQGMAESAQRAVQGVVDTISSYMPGSTAAAPTSERSLEQPTEGERPSAGEEHVSGAGALPGTSTETAVKPQEEEPSSTAALATATKEGETTQQQGTPTHHAPPAAPSTLPTQEPFGAAPHEHSSGAGRLPGNMSEASVAKLPAERAQESMPTHEEGGNAPAEHVGGVGALVGAQSEAGAAVLPEERAQVDPGKGEVLAQKETEMKGKEKQHGEEKAMTEAAGAHKGAETQVSNGFGVDADEANAQAHLSHVNLRPRTHALGLRGAHWAGVAIGAGGGYVWGEGVDIAEGEAYDTDYHPAAMHPMTGGAQVPAKGKEEPKEQTHGAAQEKPEGEPREKEKEKEKTKKAGFMEKMRGEAKVLLGKVEGKPAMVEEGKRMKAGEARAGEAKAGEAKA